MTDNPYPAPSPSVLIQMLRIQAWSDYIDDDSRKFHEWSADALEASHNRNCTLARKLESLEAYVETLLQQKGGAA